MVERLAAYDDFSSYLEFCIVSRFVAKWVSLLEGASVVTFTLYSNLHQSFLVVLKLHWDNDVGSPKGYFCKSLFGKVL